MNTIHTQNQPFQFEISLSVLNHLGRNLYRNFITVLGEAISNAWDADAENVWIYIDRENNSFVIKDDGIGMNADDFQNKFLKVGYSKRRNGQMQSRGKNRPYIGAKGIGKLALLSCAQKVSIASKKTGNDYIGGVIDNRELDNAIKHELTPDQYLLEDFNPQLFGVYVADHQHGTIIYFEGTRDDIRNTVPYLRKLIALSFRFSLLDDSFNIFVNDDDQPVSLNDITELIQKTEFLWNINQLNDPYIDALSDALVASPISLQSQLDIQGFVATVEKPRHLKITGADEKVGIDLFVNGRLREKDLLKHIPTARVAESYMYGQIHFNGLDADGKDRFTSGREGIVANDDKYQTLLAELKNVIIPKILDEWDKLRLNRNKDGDDENPRKTVKQRRARSLYNLSAQEYADHGTDEVRTWIKDLTPDAEFNIPSYVDCFLSENLIRRFIREREIPLTPRAINDIKTYKENESRHKNKANISFDISNGEDLSYLGMDTLADVVDGSTNLSAASLVRDAIEYKPMRNAVGHTTLLTDVAKRRLTSVYENIKGRLQTLLFQSVSEDE